MTGPFAIFAKKLRELFTQGPTNAGTGAADLPEPPASRDDFKIALKYGWEVAVAGESHTNPDGTSRRSIIAKLAAGGVVTLEREPDNKFDPNAVRVCSRFGVIGYVGRDNAPDIAEWIDRGETVTAYICGIAGGCPEDGKPDYGVWLRVVSAEQLPAWIKRRDRQTREKPGKRTQASA